MKVFLRHLLLILSASPLLSSAELNLEFTLTWDEQPLPLGQTKNDIRPTRADFLLSQFALQKPDNTWLKASQDLIAFISFHQNRTQFELGQLPDGEFKAIRFTIGLPTEINHSDPNLYQPDHALNPNLNNLHWTWQTGYIFCALEGYSASDLGYLYHLGNDENTTPITLPLDLDSSSPQTLTLDFDLQQILNSDNIDLAKDTSTHSRDNDPIATKIRNGLATAFSVANLRPGVFHSSKSAVSSGTPQPAFIGSHLPKVAFPADNPLTKEGISLGKKLFFEPLLSRDHSISCASCHAPDKAFTDPHGSALSSGIDDQKGSRNSMPLFNLAWHKEMFWDGRKSSLRTQILDPISDPQEMDLPLDQALTRLNEHPKYPKLFHTAFATNSITSEYLARAIEQYLLTLVSQNTRFDLALRGVIEFTEQEKRGFQLFITEHDPEKDLFGADCFHCHGGALLTNHTFANNGLKLAPDDVGYEIATSNPLNRGQFKVPSLRNLTLTAPYMHDGRFETLEEVIDHYNSGVHRSPTLDPNLAKHPKTGLNLNLEDKNALLAFLNSLTEESIEDLEISVNQEL